MSQHAVVFNALARSQFLELVRSDLYSGERGSATRAMRQAVQLLARVPRTVGNPMYALRAAKLQVFNLTQSSIYVEYGVHDSEPLVVIRFVASFRGQVE